MHKFKYPLVFAVLIVAFSSCTKAIIDEGENIIPPIDRIVKYNPDIQTIMFNNCVTCHGGVAPSAGVDLTTYDNVRYFTENGTLVDRVTDISSPMPPSGLMTPENRQLIEKWVADNFPEN